MSSIIIFSIETSIKIVNSGYCQKVGGYIKYYSNITSVHNVYMVVLVAIGLTA